MKNLVVIILGLTLLTACGKQVGKDVTGNTPPVVTPNPGTANPPSNPSVVYTGQLNFDNHNFIVNQSFFVAPDFTNNHVPLSQTWVTIQDVAAQDTDYADSILVRLYRYSDGAQSTQCTLRRLANNTYQDTRTTQNLSYDCQIYVPQGYTLVLVFADPNGRTGQAVRTAVQIIK